MVAVFVLALTGCYYPGYYGHNRYEGSGGYDDHGPSYGGGGWFHDHGQGGGDSDGEHH